MFVFVFVFVPIAPFYNPRRANVPPRHAHHYMPRPLDTQAFRADARRHLTRRPAPRHTAPHAAQFLGKIGG